MNEKNQGANVIELLEKRLWRYKVRADDLRAVVEDWLHAHPPDEDKARADHLALLLMATQAALASGSDEEDFLELAQFAYRMIKADWDGEAEGDKEQR